MKKNQDYIEALRLMISKLSADELNVLKKHLKCFNNNKLLQILELFLKTPLPDNILEKIQQVAESKAPNNILNFLLRLKKKIDEVMMLDANIHRKDAYEENFKAQFAIAKELPLVQLYFGRGLIKEKKNPLNITHCGWEIWLF